MDLKVPFSKAKSKSEAFQLAKAQITPEYVAKFKVKADITYNESKSEIEAKGKGFSLLMNFTDSESQVKADLSFMLKPFKKTILEAIENKLKKYV